MSERKVSNVSPFELILKSKEVKKLDKNIKEPNNGIYHSITHIQNKQIEKLLTE